jgi:hypothetical protein
MPLLIAGAIVFVLLGIVWTAHRHSARANAKSDLDGLLNDINNKGQAGRDHLREASIAARHDQAVAAAAAAKSLRALPPTLTEADLRALIEADGLFHENVTVRVPKYFDSRDYASVAKTYPALGPAKREGLVEFDPPFDGVHPTDEPIEVKTPSMALYKVEMVSDRGDTYEIDVGKRTLDTVTVQTVTDFKVEAAFTFTYEHEVGNALKPDGYAKTGHASLARGADGWRLDSITRP